MQKVPTSWRPLFTGALTSETEGDVPVRVEISGDSLTLRYSIEVGGNWHRQAQPLAPLLNRFLSRVLSSCPSESTSSPSPSESAPSEASSEEASPSKA